MNPTSSILADAFDVQRRLRAHNLINAPKDEDGTETTLGDCMEDIIDFLETLERSETEENANA